MFDHHEYDYEDEVEDQVWYLYIHNCSPQTFDGILEANRHLSILYIEGTCTVAEVCDMINSMDAYFNDRFMS